MSTFVAEILILALLAEVSEPAQDLTLSKDASGCEVAKVAIDKLASSGVFKSHANFIYHRVAMVSEFGAKISVQGAFGIWQMKAEHLVIAKRVLAASVNFSLGIQSQLCVSFDSATNEDLKKPLFNLITAAVIIEVNQAVIPARKDIEEQAKYWNAIFEVDIEAEFEIAATLLDNNKGEEGSWCFVCQERPTDLVIILDDSTSISGDEWELEMQFVEKLLDSYQATFDDKLTQVAMISFSDDITHEMSYTSSQVKVKKYLKYDHVGGNTYVAPALNEATNIIQTDPKSRLDEVATKKMVFFITDGEASDEENVKAAADNLKRLPVSVYAIGTTDDTDLDHLRIVASDPDYARRYDDYDDFSADIPSIVYEGCQVGSVTSLPAGPDGSTMANVTKAESSVSVVIPGMKVKDVRYFELKFVLGSRAHVKLSPKKLDIVIYASFTLQFPCEASYDYKTSCKAGTDCDIFVRNPDSFLNDICKAVKEKGDSDSFTTTVEAEGPEGETETEDISMSITMKDDDPALWADYQEPIELKAEDQFKKENDTLIRVSFTEVLRSQISMCLAIIWLSSYLPI